MTCSWQDTWWWHWTEGYDDITTINLFHLGSVSEWECELIETDPCPGEEFASGPLCFNPWCFSVQTNKAYEVAESICPEIHGLSSAPYCKHYYYTTLHYYFQTGLVILYLWEEDAEFLEGLEQAGVSDLLYDKDTFGRLVPGQSLASRVLNVPEQQSRQLFYLKEAHTPLGSK